MVIRIWAALILALIGLEGLARGESWLQGQVLENHGGIKRPAAGAQVWIVNVGNPYTTLSDGGYRVLVPDAIRVGQTIVLYVKRRGWAIDTPQGGELQLPQGLSANIVLSPEASPEFLSSAQLDKLLASLPEEITSQVRLDGKAGEANPAQVVKDYAAKHGLSEREVTAKVEELVKQYEQSGNLDKQCLGAVYRKNLEQAATLCRKGATSKTELLKKKRQEVDTLSTSYLRSERPERKQHRSHAFLTIRALTLQGAFLRKPSVTLANQTGTEKTLEPFSVNTISPASGPTPSEETRRQFIQLAEEVVRDFKAVGDVHYANYQFDKGLAAYEESLTYLSKGELPTLWATIQWDIGRVNREIGIRTEGSAIHYHLGEAVKAYHEAQTVFTKNEFPAAWAALQDKLGTVLADQGTRADGDDGPRLLAEAVAAYRNALTVRTKEQLPQDWATTQHNLGAVFQRQGTRTSGEEGRQLLAQAVAAYRNALTVRTKVQFPRDWAATQNNLGAVFYEQGIRFNDTHDLVKSAAAYNQALTVYTNQDLPQEWAKIQNNLGIALQEQGRGTRGDAGTNLLAEAAAAYRAALTVRTKDALPQDWAATQNNLGGVLADQGVRTGGDAGLHLLTESVANYNKALTVYTKQDLPQQWAKIQNNLGVVLWDHGIRIGGQEGKKFIREAIAAYRLALQVRTKETSPFEWEETTQNLQRAEEKLEEMK